jgi:hypothetical protein
MRRSRLFIGLAFNALPMLVIAVALIFSGCASTMSKVGIGPTPLQQAQAKFGEACTGYKAFKIIIEAARQKHCGQSSCVPDATWNIAVAATNVAVAETPIVEGLLVAWQVTGQKPSEVDSALKLLTGAYNTLQGIKP